MRLMLMGTLLCGALVALVVGCTREAEPPAAGLLRHVPADTPYVFVTSRPLPDALRARLADHYAAQLAMQRSALVDLQQQLAAADGPAVALADTQRLFTVLDALLVEFEGRDTAAALRELGIEPVPRSLLYGIGLLPALRLEIVDGQRVNALLDRVEQRAAIAAVHGELGGQAYRRFDLGVVDGVLAVVGNELVAGLLADELFDRHLPLLLGQQLPATSLAHSGEVEALIEHYGFTGQGEGFVRLDTLLATLLGRASGDNAAVMQALGAAPLPISAGCLAMTEQLLAGMPRMVAGISEASDERLVTRGVWESSQAVAAHLQKLAAPVPGLGSRHDALLSFGMGLNLPQLRNAIDALLRQLIASGPACEWIDADRLQALMPQLNLALGPLTAGVRGFNLRVDEVQLDAETLQPGKVRAGLLAALDDPRGVFALGAMFNPALASLQIPADGSLVALPPGLAGDAAVPPLQVAIRDQALLVLAGSDAEQLADSLLDPPPAGPPPLLAVDYGVRRLVEQFGGLLDEAAQRLVVQGEAELADELRRQFDGFRLQGQLFERLRLAVYASADGLVMEQAMELR